MTARPLQPSEYEIQREVEVLRDLKRRSTTPGALALDPDLPNQSPPASPTTQYRLARSPSSSGQRSDTHGTKNSNQQGFSADPADDTVVTGDQDVPNNPADDPFHLFWVPASVHPEIAPGEFRAFLKEHSRNPPSGDDQVQSGPGRALTPSSSLNRKKSMLSRQYKPKEGDGVENENVVPLKRNRSLLYPTNQGPQLTINDLQKLEQLAEEASESDDPSRLRSVLRRSLSLNISPTALDLMDDMPEMGDEADAPIIVPPPGQILRRAARTKIRKPSLPGDGGGHRFGASRRGKSTPVPAGGEPRTSSDMSSSDHGDVESTPPLRRLTLSDESQPRPESSYSEEASIYDAYAREDEDEPEPMQQGPPQIPQEIIPSLPDFTTPDFSIPPPTSPAPISVPPPQSPVLHQPQPQRLAVPQPVPEQSPSRTPSPAEPVHDHRPTPPPVQPVQQVHTPPPGPSYIPPPSTPSPPQGGRKEKEKDKKGLFGKWGGDKASKKGGKDKGENSARSNEKDTGFFGSIFGKKKQDSEYQSSMTGGTSGREAAQALLGASKTAKSYVPSTSPGLAPGIGGNPYARYPIHVERAIYRLSHIKLANPRRPLYEQVLISNLMFWYLGVINKAQSAAQAGANGTANESKEDDEQEQREREEKERREKAEKERLEKERLEKEQREREMEMKKKESGRRGSLTKTPVNGPPGGGRRAEMPVKGPQYEMQHRVMEQEYGGYNGPPPRSPPAGGSGPPMGGMNGRPGQPYPQQQLQQRPYDGGGGGGGPPPNMMPPQQQQPHYYPGPPPNMQPQHHQQRPGLPPGAMPPVDHSGWNQQQGGPPPQMRHPVPGQQLPGPHQGGGGPYPAGPYSGPYPGPHQQGQFSGPPPPTPPMAAGPHRRSQSPPSFSQQPPQKPLQQQLHKLNTSQEHLNMGGGGPGGRGGGPGPGRSLSATASMGMGPVLPQPNGSLSRKGNSAHAVVPVPNSSTGAGGKRPKTAEGRNGEEEDVPLAVWQQQRRK